MQPHIRLAWLLAATTALGFGARWKLGRAADWLPSVPAQVGVWTSTATTIPDYQHSILERPNYIMREYRDPFGSRVTAMVVSATARHNVHDPRDCGVGSGFELTGTRRVPIGGPGEFARGMVFRKHGARLIMLYWTQPTGGKAFAPSLEKGGYLAPVRSSITVWRATLTGRPLCLTRVYAFVRDSDEDGQETLANVREIAGVIHHAIRSAH